MNKRDRESWSLEGLGSLGLGMSRGLERNNNEAVTNDERGNNKDDVSGKLASTSVGELELGRIHFKKK